MPNSGYGRRDFLNTALGAAAAFAARPVRAAAQYRRYNVMSTGGQKALASYAKAIQIMLKLPPSDPNNWFRNAFTHLMDCPHGNWWFYVWHRGYVGYFEQTIRTLSQDSTFAMPYWDWTTLPQIPDSMFNGVLTPVDQAFAPYTADINRFTSFIKPALKAYWDKLSPAQVAQQDSRGYKNFDLMWNDVTGAGNPENMAFAATPIARYLTRTNPKLSPDVAADVTLDVVYSGLLPTDFNNAEPYLSFTSLKTTSHNAAPTRGKFSVLEGMPHNNVHNYIGGVGAHDAPWGNMTNNLSPVDPIFFLHHSNMDRLWDVWTRKQMKLKLPYLPSGADLATLSNEPFLFYVNYKGVPVGSTKAGEFLSTDKFNYDYEPGSGENIVGTPASPLLTSKHAAPVQGKLSADSAEFTVPAGLVRTHMATSQGATLFAQVTMPRPVGASARTYRVIVGAPAGATDIGPGSPYFAGIIGFFGGTMGGMSMSGDDVTFTVPLPKAVVTFHNLTATAANAPVNIRVVPAYGPASKSPVVLKSAAILSM